MRTLALTRGCVVVHADLRTEAFDRHGASSQECACGRCSAVVLNPQLAPPRVMGCPVLSVPLSERSTGLPCRSACVGVSLASVVFSLSLSRICERTQSVCNGADMIDIVV